MNKTSLRVSANCVSVSRGCGDDLQASAVYECMSREKHYTKELLENFFLFLKMLQQFHSNRKWVSRKRTDETISVNRVLLCGAFY